MPTEDRWPPTPPRGDSRVRPGAVDPRRGGVHPPPGVYGTPRPGGAPPSGAASRPGGSATTYGRPRTPRQATPTTPDDGPLFGRSRPIRGHGRRKRRVPILSIVILVIGLAVVGAGLRFVPGSPFAARGTAGAGRPQETTPPPKPVPLPFRSAPVTLESVNTTGFLSWALLDRRTGAIVGSANMTATSTTASMIKAWLAADYLRMADEDGRTPTKSRLADLEIMIRDSDNDAGERTYIADGRTESIKRLISLCKLTDSKAVPGLWSNTTVSARDTVRMGECIADGTAAGQKWTPWLLDMMRKVRDIGDFGIRKALPANVQPTVAIKNGWLLRDTDHNWHTSCLAIGDTWVMAVLQRYPTHGNWDVDFAHTQQVCENTARLLLNPEAELPSTP